MDIFELEKDSYLEAMAEPIGRIAHDYNNIIAAVEGYCELALNGLEEGSQIYRDINEIKQVVEEAAKFNRQLLFFSRRKNITKEEVDLSYFIESNKYEEYVSPFTLKFELESVKAAINKEQINDLIMILLKNAMEASSTQGIIKIKTGRDIYPFISITDFGTGIKKENLSKIFYPYFTDKQGHRGLGLSLAYGIISRHNAKIIVNTEYGKGSEFKILFL